MPYKTPRQLSNGKWVLPKVEGGYHKTQNGKVVYFNSKEEAAAAGRAIMYSEAKAGGHK